METARLLLLQLQAADLVAIFFNATRADQDVTASLGWPRHESVADTQAFLRFSAVEWESWPAGHS